jgi:hypothetical protein
MLNKPNYKDHLRAAVERRSMEEQEQEQEASPGSASILSSVDSSECDPTPTPPSTPSITGASVDGESSFLSVTPSMLTSSIFEGEIIRSVVSSDDSSDQDDDDDEEEPCWYDRSTFESVGSQLEEGIHTGSTATGTATDNNTAPTITTNNTPPYQEEENDSRTRTSTTTTTTTTTTTIEEEETKNHEKEQANKSTEATTMGAVLQAGTIVLGAVGIFLILALGGQEAKKNKRKKSKLLETKQKGQRDHENKRTNWLQRDW